ncbi:shikimate kinase [Polluticoccus soli]|uniref:shikimate kinase n=1 Tax=Polluticoccus soli TaxID=3034150 RepID=UPI0023E1BB0D|nr:shikimate kinase [Flavipsychrobacter sp. JY13-12]
MSLIFLTGMPGAGKTYWGRRISDAQGLPFVDMDEYIENRENRTITEIFELEGERGFRQIEAAALREIITATGNGIIASGGGTVTHDGSLEAMRAAGCIVYLKAEIKTLANRLQNEADKRPLLTQTPYLLPTLQQMLSAREGFYEQADHILEVESLQDTTFAQIIDSCIKQRS